MIKNIITHTVAFLTGAAIFAACGLIICERVEAFGGEVETDD